MNTEHGPVASEREQAAETVLLTSLETEPELAKLISRGIAMALGVPEIADTYPPTVVDMALRVRSAIDASIDAEERRRFLSIGMVEHMTPAERRRQRRLAISRLSGVTSDSPS